MDNYYKILGVPLQASQQEIRERFRFLANAYHPDKFSSASHKENAEEEFKKINQAYQVLSVPAKRAEYDRRLGLVRSTASPQHNSPQNPKPAGQPAVDIYALGRSFVRTVVFMLLFYIAINVVLRMGVSGLILVLILAGLIYTKYFWK